jgi:hypothetical protein
MMNVCTISRIFLFIILAIPNAFAAKDSDTARPSEPQGRGGHVSPDATNSDSSDDQGDWLLKALGGGEANHLIRREALGRFMGERIPVIELSSDDEEGPENFITIAFNFGGERPLRYIFLFIEY